MTPPRHDQTTQAYVKNLLNVPDNYEAIFETLNTEQRLGLALMRISNDITGIHEHGCQQGANDRRRIGRLERLMTWTIGAVAGITAGAGMVWFALSLFRFTRVK